MKLIDAIRKIDELDGMTLCLRRPWRADSEVCLVSDTVSKIPEPIRSEGYDYFLEAFVIRELLEMPEVARASENEKVDLILYYAEHDAFPEWIHSNRS